MQVDLSDTAQLTEKVESAVKEVGPIDGMALVAGMLYSFPLKFVKEETWEKIEKVNLYSTIELAKLYTKKGFKPAGVGGELLQCRATADRSALLLVFVIQPLKQDLLE